MATIYMDYITPGNSLRITNNLIDHAVKAYQKRQRARVETFFKFVDIIYERLSSSDQDKFNEYLNSTRGQEIIADFADSIINTSSKRVHMALAMIYAKDPDFDLNQIEIKTFLTGTNGIDDELIDFFLFTTTLERDSLGSPYPLVSINPFLSSSHWSSDLTYLFTNELIQRRLVLPDPVSGRLSEMGMEANYNIFIGLPELSVKFSRLLAKAGELIN